MYQLVRRHTVHGKPVYRELYIGEAVMMNNWCEWLNELCERRKLKCRFFLVEC